MCKHFLSILALLVLVSTGFTLQGCGNNESSSGKPVVLCSIFAYFDAARAIAGDRFDVRILLPPSSSPHEYESTVSDKVAASKTALYIKNGMGLDDRFDKLFDGSKAKIISISAQVPKDMFLTTQEISLNDVAASIPAAPPGQPRAVLPNPHIWLDPLVQIKAAEIIRDAMIDFDPAGKEAFAQNATRYIAQLRQLDADYKTQTATFKNRDFIGFHSAYDYLAHRYGLRQIASIEELPGSDITIEQTRKIIALIQQRQIKYIAVETAFNASSIKLIEQETGAKEIVLQPLETYDDAKDTYEGYMRKNLTALKTVLGG